MIDLSQKFIQFKLWENCSVLCKFCYLQNRAISNFEERKSRLKKAKDLLKEVASSYQRFGLIGGEFFTGELAGLEKEWFELIAAINNCKFDQVTIATSLLQKDSSLILKTADLLKDSHFIVCTSYDSEGRFKNEEEKNRWIKNKNELLNKGIEVNVTLIPTKATLNLLDSPAGSDLACSCMNFVNPELVFQDTINCDRNSYHEFFCEKNKFFTLPTRREFLDFLSRHPDILKNYARYKGMHSSIVVDFDHPFIQEHDRYNINDDFFLDPSKCGHKFTSRWYPDSDKCSECDAEALFASLNQ